MFRTRHLNKFKKCYLVVPTQSSVGHVIRRYLDRARQCKIPIEPPADFESLDRSLRRSDLQRLCKDGSNRLFSFCAIMAWGMRKRYGWRDFDASITHKKLTTTLCKLCSVRTRKKYFE